MGESTRGTSPQRLSGFLAALADDTDGDSLADFAGNGWFSDCRGRRRLFHPALARDAAVAVHVRLQRGRRVV